MLLTATKLTPEALISAPRRSTPVPNPSGTRAIYTVNSYSFQTHSKSGQVRLLDLATGQSSVLFDKGLPYSDPVWLTDDDFLMLKSLDSPPALRGCTALVVCCADTPEVAKEIRCFEGAVGNLKAVPLGEDGEDAEDAADGRSEGRKRRGKRYAIACSAPATPEGVMYHSEGDKANNGKNGKQKSYSSGRIYTSLYVRHWDRYTTPNRNSLWYGAVRRHTRKRTDAAAVTEPGGSSNAAGDGAETEAQHLGSTEEEETVYTLESPGLVNLLQSAPLRLESPVPPFGGTGDFDLSPAGIVFTARDPTIDPACHTKTDLYFVPLKTFTESSPPAPRMLKTEPSLRGYSSTPRFSPTDPLRIAFTRQRSDQYEADKNRLMVLDDISDEACVAKEFYATSDGQGDWDARPEAVEWSRDGKLIYCLAEHHARNRLWRVPSSDPDKAAALGLPQFVSLAPDEDKLGGSVREMAVLGGGEGTRLLLHCSSLTDSSWYTIVEDGSAGDEAKTTPAPHTRILSSATHHGRTLGLSRDQVSSIWFTGSKGDRVQALVVRPSSFTADRAADPTKKYPLAFLVHGGPQGAWLDDWSLRWNGALFAEQGYVAVMCNPTGSTGYGQRFTDAIRGHWGGYPYRDLELCVEHVAATMSDFVSIDERGVCLGASYGGYMVNWIQGNALGRRFRALVCHDGVFSTANQFATEELFFPLHDFEGPPWGEAGRANYERWNPASRTHNWQTPQMVIHNELDYRLPISEGLAAFNVLQARGVPSKFLTFPDENHVSRYNASCSLFDLVLGRPSPVVRSLLRSRRPR